MDKNVINKGKKITKTFQGGIYEELSLMRKGIWALCVLTDVDNSFTTEEITKANLIKEQLLTMNTKIESMVGGMK